jgi:hypothetical protein
MHAEEFWSAEKIAEFCELLAEHLLVLNQSRIPWDLNFTLMPPESSVDGIWLCGMILAVKNESGEVVHQQSISGIPSLVYRYLGECMSHALGCDCERCQKFIKTMIGECRKVSDACMKLNLGQMTREEAVKKAQGVWVTQEPSDSHTVH